MLDFVSGFPYLYTSAGSFIAYVCVCAYICIYLHIMAHIYAHYIGPYSTHIRNFKLVLRANL